MSKKKTIEVLETNLLEHEAVNAWSRLQPERVEPKGIEILKLREKSAVYRMTGVRPDGSAIIAKRCPRTVGLVERNIYQKLFADQTVPSLRWYGFVEESDDYSWLFLEDAGAGAYLPSCAEHRALAGRWLGALHAAASKSGLEVVLPDRSPVHYLKGLQTSREEMRRHFDNPA